MLHIKPQWRTSLWIRKSVNCSLTGSSLKKRVHASIRGDAQQHVLGVEEAGGGALPRKPILQLAPQVNHHFQFGLFIWFWFFVQVNIGLEQTVFVRASALTVP